MKKIYLALGHVALEEYLKNKLSKEYILCGLSTYREGVVKGLSQYNPDVLIIRETLGGSLDPLTLVHEVRKKFPDLRIVYIAGKREPGDKFLSALVSYGVYDIIYGDAVDAEKVVHVVRNKMEYKDVIHLQPVPLMNGDNVSFVAPEAETVIVEKIIEKEVIIRPDIPTTKEVEPKPVKVKAETVKEPILSGSKDFMNKLFGTHDKSKEHIEKTIQSKQIFSFIGGRNGTGNTTVAYNTAISLASKGYKTIFIEVDEHQPSVMCWLNVGYHKRGIDSVLSAIEDNELFKIEEAIIKMGQLATEKRDLQDSYMKIPATLDLMFFSDSYLAKDMEVSKIYNFELIKEMILYLAFQKSYDYIILDLKANSNETIIRNALLYSNKLVITVTQDISSITYSINMLKKLKTAGIEIAERPTYVVNNFTKSKLNEKHLQDWLETKDITFVANQMDVAINTNLLGLPMYVDKKNVKFVQSINRITDKLTKI